MTTNVPVACVTFYYKSIKNGIKRDELVCAYKGLRVVPSRLFPQGEEAGRVGEGVGIVQESDSPLGNLKVYWIKNGDSTCWTRAADHGLDVMTEVTKVTESHQDLTTLCECTPAGYAQKWWYLTLYCTTSLFNLACFTSSSAIT